MGWHGPTFTDSGGFQVMSLGVRLQEGASAMAGPGEPHPTGTRVGIDAAAPGKERHGAMVDDDGVWISSPILDGSTHRFTPEISMGRSSTGLGADIMFAFDELTTLVRHPTAIRSSRWTARTGGPDAASSSTTG
jgi:queuine tRNA-ribosyltransferase